MTRQFATLREIVADDKSKRREQQERNGFGDRQVTGRVVMVDRRCPYDPAEAIVMLLIATAAGGLVRVPLTSVENNALIDFAGAEGCSPARAAKEQMRLSARVAELEAALAKRRTSDGRPAKVTPQALALLFHNPIATHEQLLDELYGARNGEALNRLYGIIDGLRHLAEKAGGRIVSVRNVGWRLEADGEARRRLARYLPRDDA